MVGTRSNPASVDPCRNGCSKQGVRPVFATITDVYKRQAQPRKLGVAREEELTGAGISYCATCDGAFFRGKPVAVVGGGDTAAADALYLARFTPMVYLIHRRDSLRASKVLQERILQEPEIQLVWNLSLIHI